MQRSIEGFHQDAIGEWVAELSCLHTQHARHRPPFQERSWITTAAGRADRVGSPLDCPLCDRAELPDGLQRVRTAGPFDDRTLPAGLRRDHRVADRTWAVVRVLEGAARIAIATTPAIERVLQEGDEQPVPPGVDHALEVAQSTQIAVDFLTRPA